MSSNEREQAAYEMGKNAAKKGEPLSKYPTMLTGAANIRRAFKQGYLDGLRERNGNA